MIFLLRQQKQSLTLDIITGFHLIDGNVHLMVLEGLRCEAMQRLLDELDLSKKEGRFFLYFVEALQQKRAQLILQ